ncbi:hypothetical protein [Altericista sp. CCNU0014]|uniref:hypothetical protein n=1 Tax=Altericista sp. CCNU0014 TaxID=3082949 RepID=UPI0038502775
MASHIEIGAPRHSGGLSDEVLIQSFVDGFVQGQTSLLSNQQLRTEPLFDSVQLLSSKEGVIATAKVKDAPIKMLVRASSVYWDLLYQALLSYSFYPILKAPQEGFYLYRFCEAPENYTLYCTTARDLWRACWGRGFGVRSGIPLDLLVWRQGPPGKTKENWYSLRGMDCENGQLILKMLGWTETIDGSDLVVWSRQTTPGYGAAERQKPEVRSQIRFRQ